MRVCNLIGAFLLGRYICHRDQIFPIFTIKCYGNFCLLCKSNLTTDGTRFSHEIVGNLAVYQFVQHLFVCEMWSWFMFVPFHMVLARNLRAHIKFFAITGATFYRKPLELRLRKSPNHQANLMSNNKKLESQKVNLYS